MSNIHLIIEERPRDIGNFMVGRLLPFQGKRMVGPFIFIDHMGPKEMSAEENMDIGPHPHIGLSTLTYLFEGNMMHRDSLGTEIEIKPGEVNWMTAGKGIVHSERTPDHLRHLKKTLHGLQIWVALPSELEEMESSFYHADVNDLPAWQEGTVHYKLIAGKLGTRKSPVPVHSPLYLIEIKSQADEVVNIGNDLFGEAGLYILEGEVISEDNSFGPKQLLVAKNSKLCSFKMTAGTSVYIFGGDPLPEERLIYWNFVATDKEHIEQAKQRWRDHDFDPIPGEHGYLPLPKDPPHLQLK